jgi:hypothetical protein
VLHQPSILWDFSLFWFFDWKIWNLMSVCGLSFEGGMGLGSGIGNCVLVMHSPIEQVRDFFESSSAIFRFF